MRVTFKPQMQLGSHAVGEVRLDLECRHELVPILRALQHLEGKRKVRDRILKSIRKDLTGTKRCNLGRDGMSCWEALVLAAVRLGCDLNYDALHDLANNHQALRGIMGLGPFDEKRFPRSTLHDNLRCIRQETMDEISHLVVQEGHQVLRTGPKKVRGDGFVVETNIHYPTEANLMLDGLRKMVELAAEWSGRTGIGGWRQHNHLVKKGKKLCREIGKAARSRKDNTERLHRLFGELIAHVRGIAARCLRTVEEVEAIGGEAKVLEGTQREGVREQVRHFVGLTQKVCDVAERRVIKGEKVPAAEKLFSLFEPHTQLINRGKSPHPIEFGRHVVTAQDQVGFIVGYRILEARELEQDIAVPFVSELQDEWNHCIEVISLDRGFYAPENVEQLQSKVPMVCLPKKGKLRGAALERETAKEFRKARGWHSGIESGIHALISGNGLDRCRDKGERGFHRYVALAVLGRNIQTLGQVLLDKERRRRRRQAAALPLAA